MVTFRTRRSVGRSSVLPFSSRQSRNILGYPEDGGSKLLRNTGTYINLHGVIPQNAGI